MKEVMKKMKGEVMKKKFAVLAVLMCFMLMSGCAWISANVKPWDQRTPKEKALAVLETWNTEFRNTETQAKRTDLTETEKETVRIKKAILKESKPLIDVYRQTVNGGGIPTKESEDQILALLDKLGAKIAGR